MDTSKPIKVVLHVEFPIPTIRILNHGKGATILDENEVIKRVSGYLVYSSSNYTAHRLKNNFAIGCCEDTPNLCELCNDNGFFTVRERCTVGEDRSMIQMTYDTHRAVLKYSINCFCSGTVKHDMAMLNDFLHDVINHEMLNVEIYFRHEKYGYYSPCRFPLSTIVKFEIEGEKQ